MIKKSLIFAGYINVLVVYAHFLHEMKIILLTITDTDKVRLVAIDTLIYVKEIWFVAITNVLVREKK